MSIKYTMGLMEIFKKQGGMKLIEQYYRGGALFTAICEFLILGKEKKALEILRLSAQYKIQKNLRKKYNKDIEDFLLGYDSSVPSVASNKVWVCWFQGMDHAPDIVKKCYKSLKDNLNDREIILVTKDNMFDYVKFPDFIIDKWKKGQISNTHMSDLLRLELLIKYGGMWVDSTVFCTSKRRDIPDYFFDSDLFFYQSFKPGRDGHCQPVSNWLISAKTNNKILLMTRYLCYKYWYENSTVVDYFIFHDFFVMSLEKNKSEWDKVLPRDNAAPHYLLLRLFDKYDEQTWRAIKEQTPFHKLTYKFDNNDAKKKETYYEVLFGKELR